MIAFTRCVPGVGSRRGRTTAKTEKQRLPPRPGEDQRVVEPGAQPLRFRRPRLRFRGSGDPRDLARRARSRCGRGRDVETGGSACRRGGPPDRGRSRAPRRAARAGWRGPGEPCSPSLSREAIVVPRRSPETSTSGDPGPRRPGAASRPPGLCWRWPGSAPHPAPAPHLGLLPVLVAPGCGSKSSHGNPAARGRRPRAPARASRSPPVAPGRSSGATPRRTRAAR